MIHKKSDIIQQIFQSAHDRLSEDRVWFPVPFLISFSLVILLMGHILLGINPRLGNPATIINFPGEKSQEGAIWVSISIKTHDVYITTTDRKIFHWNENIQNNNEMKDFIEYLKNEVVKITLSTSLTKKVPIYQTMAVLAVDETVQFKHLKPVLFSLAKVGISEYGFEVKTPLKEKALAER